MVGSPCTWSLRVCTALPLLPPSSRQPALHAAAAVQHCTELWGLLAEAEALQAASSSVAEGQQEGEGEPATPKGEAAAQRVAALQERLVGLRGSGEEPPGAVWLRANTALLACKAALAG